MTALLDTTPASVSRAPLAGLEPEWCGHCARTDDPAEDPGMPVDIVEWIHDGTDEDPRDGSLCDVWVAVLSCGHDVMIRCPWLHHEAPERWLTH